MTAERAVIIAVLAVAGSGALLWLAAARERRRGTGCAFCGYTAARRDRCGCRKRCPSPRCDPQRETGRAA